MRKKGISLRTTVQEAMRRFPDTTAVFERHGMHCVGCALGRFHTVADAAHEYDLEAPRLLAALRAVVETKGSG